jgi:hypothetical protein
MTEWWTYSLRDLLLFSPQTYYRLFELHNAEWWPLPLITLALGLVLPLLLRRGSTRARQLALITLSLCWLWVAWAFHWQRYAAINLAGGYFALAFAVEALLLLRLAMTRDRFEAMPVGTLRYYIGVGILLYALLIHPLTGSLQGRSLAQAEVFGMAPDPTALATLGMLLLIVNRRFWLPALIPLLWCCITGAALWAMKAPDFFVLPFLALLAIVFASTTAVQNRIDLHR